ncbi:MAG TPA: hypothetical protein DCL54_00960 [Alphaproteobacteria bacterium]|nr:hypothetical protein [Alphaproteobacteria bacterium]HAJ45136.1 hypothetical protein [Alphaproteobacteria bacterium]
MTEKSPAQVVDAMHAAFRNADLETIAAHWHDDVEYQAPGVSLRGKAARIEAEKVWLSAFSENEVRTTSRFVNGEEIVDFAEMRGLHTGPLMLPGGASIPATGKQVAGPYVARYRVRDGKVVSQHVVYDRLALLQNLGLA